MSISGIVALSILAAIAVPVLIALLWPQKRQDAEPHRDW